jgi:hypothetical protein
VDRQRDEASVSQHNYILDGDMMKSKERAAAIGKAAVVRASIVTAERQLRDAIATATEAGRADIAARLAAALTHVERGHARANEAAVMVAEHFGEQDISVFSGPEDKPDPEPEQP